jgi:hypothetical protein
VVSLPSSELHPKIKSPKKNKVKFFIVFCFNGCQRSCIRIVRFCVRGISAGNSDVTKMH